MGSAASYEVKKPQELAEFRKLKIHGAIEDIDIPQRPENRKATNKKYLVMLLAFIVVLIPFLIYGFIFSDFRRITGHYDACGNLCGYNNTEIKGIPCTGKSMIDKPYLEFFTVYDPGLKLTELERSCVPKCPSGSDKMFYKCFVSEKRNNEDSLLKDDQINVHDIFEHIIHSLAKSWWRIVLSVLITIGISVIFLFLFRFAVVAVVWTILILTTSMFLAICAGCIYYSFKKNAVALANNVEEVENVTNMFRFFAVVTGIIGLTILILIICLRKRIGLVIQLIKEATKAIFFAPQIIFIPIVIAILQMVLIGGLISINVTLSTAADLVRVRESIFMYVIKPISVFTMVYNFIMALWILCFLHGCEYMMIAGAVAAWYFAKNKHNLSSTVWTSVYVTVRYHLGTIAVGSLIITIVSLLRSLVRGLSNSKVTKVLVDCCLHNVEELLKFLSKNAYIMTAIHGQSFYKSGKRAAKLIMANVVDIIAINSVGDYVLCVAALLVMIIANAINATLFLNLKIEDKIVPMILIFILSAFIVGCFFTLFETAIDTIFICFCEDCNINDGMARPYSMSRGMYEFMNNSKEIMGDKKM